MIPRKWEGRQDNFVQVVGIQVGMIAVGGIVEVVSIALDTEVRADQNMQAVEYMAVSKQPQVV